MSRRMSIAGAFAACFMAQSSFGADRDKILGAWKTGFI